MAPLGSALEKVKLNNMDDTSYAGISSFPLAVANPRHAIWFDHTTAHGSDEYIDCQVGIRDVAQLLAFTTLKGSTARFHLKIFSYVCKLYNFLHNF